MRKSKRFGKLIGKGQQEGGGGQAGAIGCPGEIPDKTLTGARRRGVIEPDAKISRPPSGNQSQPPV
jgi:hypothetical protein